MNELDRQIQREAMQWVRTTAFVFQGVFALLSFLFALRGYTGVWTVCAAASLVFLVMRWAAGR